MVLPPPARGAGTLIPSAQRLVWEAKQPLGKAALGAIQTTTLWLTGDPRVCSPTSRDPISLPSPVPTS